MTRMRVETPLAALKPPPVAGVASAMVAMVVMAELTAAVLAKAKAAVEAAGMAAVLVVLTGMVPLQMKTVPTRLAAAVRDIPNRH